jgi:hypothetical protein
MARGLAVVLGQRASPAQISWELPSLVVPQIHLSTSSFFAVSLPLVVLSMGLGNVQGLGVLVAQGYKVPVNRITVVLGLSSVLNALLGGHTAIVSCNGIPIMARPWAGQQESRRSTGAAPRRQLLRRNRNPYSDSSVIRLAVASDTYGNPVSEHARDRPFGREPPPLVKGSSAQSRVAHNEKTNGHAALIFLAGEGRFGLHKRDRRI